MANITSKIFWFWILLTIIPDPLNWTISTTIAYRVVRFIGLAFSREWPIFSGYFKSFCVVEVIEDDNRLVTREFRLFRGG